MDDAFDPPIVAPRNVLTINYGAIDDIHKEALEHTHSSVVPQQPHRFERVSCHATCPCYDEQEVVTTHPTANEGSSNNRSLWTASGQTTTTTPSASAYDGGVLGGFGKTTHTKGERTEECRVLRPVPWSCAHLCRL